MSIKSVFTALIATNWGDITSPKRVPLKDRQVATAILDELYPTKLTDDSTTETGVQLHWEATHRGRLSSESGLWKSWVMLS